MSSKLKVLRSSLLIVGLAFSSQVWASAQDLFLRDLTSSTHSLANSTRMYSYYTPAYNQDGTWYAYSANDIQKMGSNGRTANVNNQALGVAAGFWNNDDHSTKLANCGLGLYLAIDNYGSSPDAKQESQGNFGSTALEIEFKPGSKYLNLYIQPPTIKADTLQALAAENILSGADAKTLLTNNRFTRTTLQNMVLPQYQAFRSMIQNLFTQQEIILIEFSWQTGVGAPFCSNYNPVYGPAFVFVGQNLNHVNSNSMIYWSAAPNNLSAQESEVLQRNQKLYTLLKGNRDIYRQSGGQLSSHPDLLKQMKTNIVQTYTDSNELSAIKSETFNCR